MKLAEVEPSRLQQVLNQHAPKAPIEIAIAEVEKIIGNVRDEVSANAVAELERLIASDSCLPPLLCRDIARAVRAAISLDSDNESALEAALLADTEFVTEVQRVIHSAAAAFSTRHGPRKLPLLAPELEKVQPVVRAALTRISTIFDEVLGETYRGQKAKADEAVGSLRLSPPLVAHLSLLTGSAIQSTVPKLIGARLKNSQPFKSALKPE